MAVEYKKELNVKGAKCPLPVIKAKQEVGNLSIGEVLKVIATDPGSVNDFKGWAQVAKNIELVGQEVGRDADGKDVYIHYVKRKS